APVERAALLRVEARARARKGRAHGRRERRTACRLRQVSESAAQLARRTVLVDRARSDPALRAGHDHAGDTVARRALRAAVVPGDAPDAGSDVLRQLRGDRSAEAVDAARFAVRRGASP